jgi:hypothetical protein
MTRILSNTKFTTEITAEEISRRYLADNGMVAISRRLADFLAKSDRGVAAHYMVYHPHLDLYGMSDAAGHLINGDKELCMFKD